MSSYKKLANFGQTVEESFESIVPDIKNIDEKKKLISENVIVLINTYGTFCGPCKRIKPAFQKLYKEYTLPGVCVLANEDVELGLSKSVQVVPTFQYYVNGQFDSIITGADVEEIESHLIKLIKTYAVNKNNQQQPQQQPQQQSQQQPRPPQQSQEQYKAPQCKIRSDDNSSSGKIENFTPQYTGSAVKKQQCKKI